MLMMLIQTLKLKLTEQCERLNDILPAPEATLRRIKRLNYRNTNLKSPSFDMQNIAATAVIIVGS